MSAPTSDRGGIQQTIRALKGRGYVLVQVFDGEDTIPVQTETEAVDAVMAVDDATLTVAEGTPTGPKGWVRFVLGNEPEEVVCDYTINLESVLGPLTEGWWD